MTEYADAIEVEIAVFRFHRLQHPHMVIQPDLAEVLIGRQAEGLTALRGAAGIDLDDDGADLRHALGRIADIAAIGLVDHMGGRAGIDIFDHRIALRRIEVLRTEDHAVEHGLAIISQRTERLRRGEPTGQQR